MATKMDQPRVLIEQWLPIAEIGAECKREQGSSGERETVTWNETYC